MRLLISGSWVRAPRWASFHRKHRRKCDKCSARHGEYGVHHQREFNARVLLLVWTVNKEKWKLLHWLQEIDNSLNHLFDEIIPRLLTLTRSNYIAIALPRVLRTRIEKWMLKGIFCMLKLSFSLLFFSLMFAPFASQLWTRKHTKQ